MYGSGFFNCSLWWIWPILMMAICFFIMRGRRGTMMCGFGSRDTDSRRRGVFDSAMDILARRYASGEIDTREYEEKKRTLTKSTEKE